MPAVSPNWSNQCLSSNVLRFYAAGFAMPGAGKLTTASRGLRWQLLQQRKQGSLHARLFEGHVSGKPNPETAYHFGASVPHRLASLASLSVSAASADSLSSSVVRTAISQSCSSRVEQGSRQVACEEFVLRASASCAESYIVSSLELGK